MNTGDSAAMHCRPREAHLLARPHARVFGAVRASIWHRAREHLAPRAQAFGVSRKGEPARDMGILMLVYLHLHVHPPGRIPCPCHALYARVPIW